MTVKRPLTDAPQKYSPEELQLVMRWIKREGKTAETDGDALTMRFFLNLYRNKRARKDTADRSLDKARENGYRKRDWAAYLRNWIRRDLSQFVERHGGVVTPDAALNAPAPSRGLVEAASQMSFLDSVFKEMPPVKVLR